MKNLLKSLFALALLVPAIYAQQPRQIESWVTNNDRSALFTKQTEIKSFEERSNPRTPIIVNDRIQYQEIDGFGFALTGGSAFHLINMSQGERTKILQEMFAHNGNNVGFSYIRLSIGASDLNNFVFSYDDLKEGETDYELKKFSLSQDMKDVVPVMKEILAINPNIKILGSPWSAPAWMKTLFDVRGGKLRKECYPVYANYFIKYVQAMQKEGIIIDAITVQNEPLNSRNTPSMYWLQADQAEFIRDHLGPAFRKNNIRTKILLFDHNTDRPDYPLAILNDPKAAQYVDGSAFHNYRGEMSAMSQVYNARPDKNIYFTEQMATERPGSPQINIVPGIKRLIIDITRNWSKNVILWNLAADPLNDPHTDNGGCSMCQGAITIDGDKVTRNIAYYTVAHASKFVRPGSVRIESTIRADRGLGLHEDEQRPEAYRAVVIDQVDVLPNVAFKTLDGKIVLIVINDTWTDRSFTVQHNGLFADLTLKSGAVGTYIW
ncbi:glucosylceramidase [Bacteroidia bacterium]|nr:glucosylceramidase [Bacteroidia bacterium]